MPELATSPDLSFMQQQLTGYMQSLGNDRLPDLHIAPLAAGHHNQIFICENGPPDLPTTFVVRYPTHPSTAQSLEATALHHKEALAGVKVAAQTLGVGTLACGTTVAFEEYVNGTPKDCNELGATELHLLAEALSEIHQRHSTQYSSRSGQPADTAGTYADYLQAMVQESVVDRIAQLSADSRAQYATALEAINKGRALLDTALATADDFGIANAHGLLHHDLNGGNMLWSTTNSNTVDLKLIDPNLTYGDPADDIDYLCTDNNLSADARSTLLEAYQPPAWAGNVAGRLAAYTIKNRLDDMAWAITMHTTQPKAYAAIYADRLANLQRCLS